MSGIGTLFRKKKKWRVNLDIGNPTNVRHIVNVSKNLETGQLEGLPTSWSQLLDLQTASGEQNKGPDEAIQPGKFHTHTDKKAPDESFKSYLTYEVITENNMDVEMEIEKLLDQKHAHQSQNSDLTTPAEQNENLV